ncbi:MAG: peptidoglycan DD-metalloendopeptidase family protein, partial [Oscillospiraceae bacterium]|nr:peptidoglycan DD-metalloendopeptidase family protein [Oscillospiraceae bacterium]
MSNKKFVRIVCLILAVVLVFGLLMVGVGSMTAGAISQADIDALEDERQSIRDQQQLVIEQMDALKSEKASVIERKEALDKQNELNRQEIEIINEQIALYDQMISDKETELAEAIAAEEKQFDIYCGRVRAMEENSNWSYLSYVLKAGSISEMLGRLDDIMDIMLHDQNLEAEYVAAREFVEEVKAEYEGIQARQQEKKSELLEEKERLEGEIESAYVMIQELEEDLEAYTDAYYENQLLEVEVNAKIEQKREELAEWQRQQAIIQQQQAQQQQNQQAAQQQRPNANQSTQPSVGTNTGGGYYWPTQSSTYITSCFGYRVHPIFGTTKYHAGVDIAANSGATIGAAQSGTVGIAEYSSSYGYYVVVYHADGNSTLYAHMSSMAVSVGQSVSRGETLGYVGSTGWSTGPHLHFEV